SKKLMLDLTTCLQRLVMRDWEPSSLRLRRDDLLQTRRFFADFFDAATKLFPVFGRRIKFVVVVVIVSDAVRQKILSAINLPVFKASQCRQACPSHGLLLRSHQLPEGLVWIVVCIGNLARNPAGDLRNTP